MRRSLAVRAVAALALVLLCSCGSLAIERDTETSGTFEAKGFAVTILSWDLPSGASQIAHQNASDARLTNVTITEDSTVPNLGWFDWIFDIIGMRWSTVKGTWGFPPAASTTAPAK